MRVGKAERHVRRRHRAFRRGETCSATMPASIAMPAASSAVAGSSRIHSGRLSSDRRASPMRRRWPCDSTRAGSVRFGAERNVVERGAYRLARDRFAGQRHQRGEILLGGELVLQRRARDPRTRSPRAPSGRRARPRPPIQRISPARGCRQARKHAQQRRLAGPVGAGDHQRMSRLQRGTTSPRTAAHGRDARRVRGLRAWKGGGFRDRPGVGKRSVRKGGGDRKSSRDYSGRPSMGLAQGQGRLPANAPRTADRRQWLLRL